MPDYKKMYSTLFNTITDVISALQKAQQTTEELYISSEEPTIRVFEKHSSNNEEES